MEAQRGLGILLASQINASVEAVIRTLSRHGAERLLVILVGETAPAPQDGWSALQAGATDILIWADLTDPLAVIGAHLQRWREVDALSVSPLVKQNLVGESLGWQMVIRQLVEVARFTDAPLLLMGETGTGKELAARLIHTLDPRRDRHELVILDCTTLMPELAGSELFGHERGAFTGAVNLREGAFALADGGTLFLDEVGELPLSLQVQLLRVLQEHTYKRVGSNTWRQTDFRLIGATNRDLLQEEAKGSFRRDLYYRLASWVIRLPPLRERTEDILPLVRHFLRQALPNGEPPLLDSRLEDYFLQRAYPGNVRDLRNLVFRIAARHVGPGPITIGAIPPDERPVTYGGADAWCDLRLEQLVRRALTAGTNLKELKRVVEEAAIRLAIEDEAGNVQRAAQRLGVTDRTLQLHRAEQRQQMKANLAEAP
ncbi:MAG: sigma-54-dependent Fis family transcriptional regulator [Caldilinea sp. CFX5]|nr:sigma-54-dependent Fis family transcriptional regulator [Caldilinea sp. CFX5]